jgi:hypothetical protein
VFLCLIQSSLPGARPHRGLFLSSVTRLLCGLYTFVRRQLVCKMEGTNSKPPTPIFYISVRCLQLPLCLGTLFACGALMFYFDNDIQLTDSALGYRRVRRDAFAFPIDGASSGGSGGTTSAWGNNGVSSFTASPEAEEEYGRTRAAGTRSPQVVLLAAVGCHEIFQ